MTSELEQHIPVAPAVVAQVVEVAASPEGTAAQLAAIIERDPGLSSHVLRAVNSPFFGPRARIAIVSRAVAFVGPRAARNLVLWLSLREMTDGARARSGFPLDRFWEASLRRAAAGSCIARATGQPCIDEAFTIGLCQDLGVLLGLARRPELEAEYAALLPQSAPLRLQRERELGAGHDELGAAALERWGLPAEMVEAVRFHHGPEAAAEAHRLRAQIALAAEALCDVVEVEDKQPALRAAEAQLRQLRLADDRLGPLVDEVSAAVVEAAEMLQLRVGRQPRYEEIAAAAAANLLRMNLSYQELNDRLQEALAEQQRLAAQLREMNRELEDLAVTDELTRLPNRRAFDDGFERALVYAQRTATPLSLLLIDIDHFKQVNDAHGHLAGDLVLQHVAYVIKAVVRRSDLPARYGGEEFVIVLPSTGAEGGRVAAERLRAAVASAEVPWDGQRLRVTISVGGATVREPGRPRAAIAALRAADDALYEAKEGGRNRYCWSA
jgi:diguanylate cyclase (GGDEF)-like protein